MKKMMLGAIAGLICLTGTSFSQEAEAPIAYAYVTYFTCDASLEYRADEIVARSYKPHYDAAVEQGEILQWGWLGHFMGGPWRRALVLTAATMDDLLAAAGALGEAIQASTPEAGRVFTEVCNTHEDYIWQTVSGVGSTTVGTARGEAGFSTYIDCDINREERADELIRETFGPIYDAAVEAGDLVSWTWLAHNVGGSYRRLLSLTAIDHNTMMETRAEIISTMNSGRNQRAFNQLNEICSDHQDYMWDVLYETP